MYFFPALESLSWFLCTKPNPTGVEPVDAVSLQPRRVKRRKHDTWIGTLRRTSACRRLRSGLRLVAGTLMKGYVLSKHSIPFPSLLYKVLTSSLTGLDQISRGRRRPACRRHRYHHRRRPRCRRQCLEARSPQGMDPRSQRCHPP